jgi:hypothetical protein
MTGVLKSSAAIGHPARRAAGGCERVRAVRARPHRTSSIFCCRNHPPDQRSDRPSRAGTTERVCRRHALRCDGLDRREHRARSPARSGWVVTAHPNERSVQSTTRASRTLLLPSTHSTVFVFTTRRRGGPRLGWSQSPAPLRSFVTGPRPNGSRSCSTAGETYQLTEARS